MEGRRMMKALFEADRVFNMTVHGVVEPTAKSNILRAPQQLNLVKQCAETSEFAFQLIFIQKSAPEVWSCVISPGNDMLTIARDHIDHTLDTYRHLLKEHGTKTWPPTWQLGELNMADMPGGEWGWN
jgi:hypothetical protein